MVFLDVYSSINSIRKCMPFLLGPELQEFLILSSLLCMSAYVCVTSTFMIEINIEFRFTVSENGMSFLLSVLVYRARGVFRKTPSGNETVADSGRRTSKFGTGWRKVLQDLPDSDLLLQTCLCLQAFRRKWRM